MAKTMTQKSVPMDGDDYTWEVDEDAEMSFPAFIRMIYRMKNELAALSDQVIEVKNENAKLRQLISEWTGE